MTTRALHAERFLITLCKEVYKFLISDDIWCFPIRKDKKHPGVSIEISKGDAVYNLVLLCRTGVINMSDLEEFSDSTKDAVRQLLDLR